MYEITPETRDRLVVMKAIGRLTATDYEIIRPRFEQLAAAASGPLHVLLDWSELTGWNAEGERDAFAMWAQEWSDVERMAIVSGDKFIEDGLQIAKVLSKTTVRHFQLADAAEARAWLTV
ncbi:SpoIIAA family protein [Defluviicoccus vanus]|uniref:STAS/SEC14 domain-containing protein n=1 Tax=Defluviicoccus vanus TaxID=111831 RepID=A0A7H1MZG0_9PROT|nr:STAS/SEC14 domain-containing protein [Defluviicoccus vanus]QNT68846.1 STAS/SEC14 domain-containing protein [Defluviicoccus vanus]